MTNNKIKGIVPFTIEVLEIELSNGIPYHTEMMQQALAGLIALRDAVPDLTEEGRYFLEVDIQVAESLPEKQLHNTTSI